MSITHPATGAVFADDTRFPPVGSPLSGNGTPEGAVKSPVGGIYLRKDGGAITTLYVKETGTGNTGWVAK